MREKAIWLTEGVTLSGALRGGTVCGHTLESAILAAEGVRIEIQISQAKGQGRCSNGNMHAGSVFVFRAGFYIVPSYPGVRNFEGGSECECLTC